MKYVKTTGAENLKDCYFCFHDTHQRLEVRGRRYGICTNCRRKISLLFFPKLTGLRKRVTP